MRRTSERLHAILASSVFIVAVALVGSFFLLKPLPVQSQTSSTPILGYLWSDGIGWIDLNCLNSGSCALYGNWGLSVDASGNITGYAWSDNIGWISANSGDVSGCPSAPCSPRLSAGNMSGWFKALAADNNDWDGWISISGSGYGPTENLATGQITGYSWGSENVGWLSWQASTKAGTCSLSYSCTGSGGQTITETFPDCSTQTITTCIAPQFCSNGSKVCLLPTTSGTFSVAPGIVSNGNTAVLTWNVQSVSTCTITGTNNDSFSVPVANSNASGNHTTIAINQQTTYTLTCTGLDSSQFLKTVSVDVVPGFHEK